MKRKLLGFLTFVGFMALLTANFNNGVQREKVYLSIKYFKTSLAGTEEIDEVEKVNWVANSCIIDGKPGIICTQDHGGDCTTPGPCIPITE